MTTWTDWMQRHADAFGFGLYEKSAEKELAMLASWSRMFAAEGYQPDDLLAATRVMESRPTTPEYRDQHRAELLAVLRQRRVQRLEAMAGQARQGGGDVTLPMCRDCDNTGICSVPYPEGSSQQRHALLAGVLATCAVSCDCAVGQSRRPQTRHGEAMMTLAEYEVSVPNWRRIVERHREAVRALGGAICEATDMDREFGKIVKPLEKARKG